MLHVDFLLSLLIFHVVCDVPDHEPQSFTYGRVKTARTLLLEFFAEVAHHFGDERNQSFLKNLSSDSKLTDLLFDLIQVHEVVEFAKLREKQIHSIIVRDVLRHQQP